MNEFHVGQRVFIIENPNDQPKIFIGEVTEKSSSRKGPWCRHLARAEWLLDGHDLRGFDFLLSFPPLAACTLFNPERELIIAIDDQTIQLLRLIVRGSETAAGLQRKLDFFRTVAASAPKEDRKSQPLSEVSPPAVVDEENPLNDDATDEVPMSDGRHIHWDHVEIVRTEGEWAFLRVFDGSGAPGHFKVRQESIRWKK